MILWKVDLFWEVTLLDEKVGERARHIVIDNV